MSLFLTAMPVVTVLPGDHFGYVFAGGVVDQQFTDHNVEARRVMHRQFSTLRTPLKFFYRFGQSAFQVGWAIKQFDRGLECDLQHVLIALFFTFGRDGFYIE